MKYMSKSKSLAPKVRLANKKQPLENIEETQSNKITNKNSDKSNQNNSNTDSLEEVKENLNLEKNSQTEKVEKISNIEENNEDIIKTSFNKEQKELKNQKSKQVKTKEVAKDSNKTNISKQTNQKVDENINILAKYEPKKDVKNIRPIIQVRNLVKKYGNFTAVNNVSFEVKRGEIFGILGPNGAGKTTTLEIIETILPKTQGTILIDGLDIEVYTEQIKNMIGIQLQSSGFYPKLNLIEILQMFAAIYNVKIKPKELLDKVGLKEKAKSVVENLSGGQKQRFSIATTLVADPEVIFLDEPTTGLDPQARRNLWELILTLKKQGKTVVLTTHYMEEAEELCDRIAIMNAGKIIEINTARAFIEELLDRGFKRSERRLQATLEDVFLDLTGKNWQD
jgi:ABC-2 type transport system ATP-binding protein